ncbi:polysaccharide deacetylase family protein [Marinobacter mobilis]|uniref:polysaccharide deacetylase family protein n=1 Tax=Marinobacter mobilis TaxID=488533 RepID=UPI0035C6E3F5
MTPSYTRQMMAFFLCLLFAGVCRADLVILQYHHVSDATPPSTSTSQSLFRAQLDMIAELDLEVVPLETGSRAALRGELNDSQQLAITFDDAYSSVLTNAVPLLLERNLPFTIFVNTDSVGHQGYLNWQQLTELNAQTLVTIANHSADHSHLVRRPEESATSWKARVSASLDNAQAALKQYLGTDVAMIAYPYGEFSAELEQLVAERGWYGYGQQSGAVGVSSVATRLPRFPMATGFGQLTSLKDKLLSKAFPIDASHLPDSPITANPPTLSLTLPQHFDQNLLTCFASGHGRISVAADEDWQQVSVRAPQPFSSRRFRYNCTYPAGNGRYFWLSQSWLDLSQAED